MKITLRKKFDQQLNRWYQNLIYLKYYHTKPSRTFTTIPDIYYHADKYHPGHLPSTRTVTIPDSYHPGQIPSRTFTIPDIYHPGHLPSRTFTLNPDSYQPGHLPSCLISSTTPSTGSLTAWISSGLF